MNQNPDESFLRSLFAKFLDNQCSEQEIDLLMEYADKEPYRDLFFGMMNQVGGDDPLTDETLYVLHKEAIDAVGARITPSVPKKKANRRIGWPYQVAAAVALLVMLSGAWFWYDHAISNTIKKTRITATSAQPAHDLPPAGKKALLILANGTAVTLDSASNGILTRQGNTKISQLTVGNLVYSAGAGQPAAPLFNSVITPRGGQYQVTLSDGTKVWLNAASSLHFPTAFTDTVRQVLLKGEAYFEVAKNAGKPFVVVVNNTRVTVLGTHFNVMAYGDEAAVNTTLLEGSVKVTEGKATTLLEPGQQAQVDRKGNISLLRKVDLNAAIAWKNRLFWFDEDDIQTVMRQISREYNIDVMIQGNIQRHFTGSIPRDVNISTVFEVLQKTGGVHFTVNNGKIIVTP